MIDDAPEDRGGRVRKVAAAFPYPPTPRLRARPAGDRPARGFRVQRRVVVWATIAVAVSLATMTATPRARAGVVRMITVGVDRLFFGEAGASRPPSTPVDATPSASASRTETSAPTTSPPVSILEGWLGETTLEGAMANAGFPVLLPTYPPDLGPPDRVFLQNQGGAVVLLAWTSDDGREIPLLLEELSPESWGLRKVGLQQVTSTKVHGNQAIWATGPYLLLTSDGKMVEQRIVGGHALIWDQQGTTFRLETPLNMDEAVKIAESLK